MIVWRFHQHVYLFIWSFITLLFLTFIFPFTAFAFVLFAERSELYFTYMLLLFVLLIVVHPLHLPRSPLRMRLRLYKYLELSHLLNYFCFIIYSLSLMTLSLEMLNITGN
jgi:hypothetical protein